MTAPATARRAMLLAAVLSTFAAQQVVMPVLAPLAREIGLSEFRLGLVISLSAAMLVVASPLWGRLCDRRGAKPLLVAGLALATIGLAGFAAVCRLALAGTLDTTTAYLAMLATRSIVFGVGLSAVPVAAMAAISASTSAEERTGGIARLGAMQALSLVVGPALGGLVAFAGLLGPLVLAPAALAVMTVLAALLLPGRPPTPADRSTARPARDPATRVRPLDPRIWPYLATGFLIFLSLGLTLLTVGFLLQDRLGLDAAATARTSGAVLFACGLVLVVAQGVVVPRLGWPPARLLRVGTPIAVVGALGLAVAPGLAAITAAMVVLALGLGVGQIGYTSGPTLHAAPSEQGAVAGLVQATNGVTFVVGPAAGAALYGLAPAAPFVAAAGATALALVVVLVHPTLRREREVAPAG